MDTKRMIQELEEEKKSLDMRIIKINSVIADLEKLEGKTEPVKVRDYTKKKSGRRTKRVYPDGLKEFIKANTDQSNQELIKSIKQKFSLNLNSKELSQYLYLNKMSRKKRIRGKNKNGKKKHPCENCHENPGTAWFDKKLLCKRCLDLKKKGEESVIRKEKRNPGAYKEEEYDPAELEADDLEE